MPEPGLVAVPREPCQMVVVRLSELFVGLRDRPRYHGCDPDTVIERLVVDSRQAGPRAAFLALRGSTHDGHAFLDDVFARGTRVAIVERGRLPTADFPRVELSDTTEAYPLLAANAYGRPGERLRLVGITGTNGKTTVSYLLAAIFEHAAVLHARLGTTGNWIVDRDVAAALTTLFPNELQATLADAEKRGAQAVVMEASSHALAQRRVEPLVYEAVGLTSFSRDHLDFHPNMAAYLEAKCRLARHHLRGDGVAVAAVDDHEAAAQQFLGAAPAGARKWKASRGGHPGADIVARSLSFTASGIEAEVDTPAGTLALHSPLVGAFNVDNLLVTIGLAVGMNLGLDAIARALQTAAGAPGRLERVRSAGAGGPTVFVDYAHTPDAVARTLTAVRQQAVGRLIVVLGCGGDRDPSKRPQMGSIAARLGDRFYATSDNPRTEDPDAIIEQMVAGVDESRRPHVVIEPDRRRAIERAILEASSEDTVVIAGKGHESYQIIGTNRIEFDDRVHARRTLESLAP